MYDAHSLSGIIKKIGSDLPRRVEYLKKEPILTIGYMTFLDMNTPTRYQTVRVEESRNSKLVGILLAHPKSAISKSEIVSHLNYFHHRSGEAIDFFCVGYGSYWPENHYPDQDSTARIDGVDWFFSEKAFADVIHEIESESKWQYSGEAELLIISARRQKDGNTSMDYSSAIVCNLEAMQKDQAFTSVRSFFEDIFRFAKKSSCSDEAWGLSDQQGLRVGQSAIKDAVLSLLPKNLRDSYKKAEYFAVRNIA
ncbi:hypothetical protein [Idiomarina xiamenensis]|uniref:Uncharacterized protein n=1 Tax=Idiomarina xiamenensis 10-D-4 TaxID=740709 RepID=K2KID6_9GAMM|nr:hypothetical protein [Idiomarina xiamenensis]EKE87643.1 hypothetical protein A10D4_01075 [Idiomarina xiamenensis 10-D-4]